MQQNPRLAAIASSMIAQGAKEETHPAALLSSAILMGMLLDRQDPDWVQHMLADSMELHERDQFERMALELIRQLPRPAPEPLDVEKAEPA